jgi:DNA-binding MarR family transcriptional regulator
MTPKPVAKQDKPKFQELIDARAATVDHYFKAIEFSKQRSVLIAELMGVGYSQSDIARELGVSRQAVQKMLAIHRERGLRHKLATHGKKTTENNGSATD